MQNDEFVWWNLDINNLVIQLSDTRHKSKYRMYTEIALLYPPHPQNVISLDLNQLYD